MPLLAWVIIGPMGAWFITLIVGGLGARAGTVELLRFMWMAGSFLFCLFAAVLDFLFALGWQ